MQVTHLGLAEPKVSFEVRDLGDTLPRVVMPEPAPHENEMLADIKRRLTAGSLVVDIGAHTGDHTLFFATVCEAQVVAIEPFPASYDRLVRTIGLNQLSARVSVLNLAIGDRRGRGAFELLDTKRAGSVAGTVKVRPSGSAGEVDIVPLDELTLPGAPDLLEIDIEGAELAALAGAERTIRAHRPLVYVKVRAPLALKKTIAFFDAAGYRVVAGFNETPIFLFAHRDDPRAAEDAGSVAAGFAMHTVARYQGHRKALQNEHRKRKEKKQFSPQRSFRALLARWRRAGPAGADRAGDTPSDALARIVQAGRDHCEQRQRAWVATGLPFVPLRDQTALRELGEGAADGLPRVTILLPTHRADDLPNIRRTLLSQDYPNIEVVLILNNDAFDPETFRRELAAVPRLQVIQVPEHQPLGACHNQGVAHATGDYFARVDGDDLYGPRYISDMVCTAVRSGADILGKNRCFYFISYTNELLLRTSKRNNLAGGTLFFSRHVTQDVKFSTDIVVGSDRRFVEDCRRHGFSVTSADPFNYCLVRHDDRTRHTWAATDKGLYANAELLSNDLRTDVIFI